MPKLNHRPPKYCKLNKYAVVYYHGKPHYLGLYGSAESKIAYSRFVAELQANPAFFLLMSTFQRWRAGIASPKNPGTAILRTLSTDHAPAAQIKGGGP